MNFENLVLSDSSLIQRNACYRFLLGEVLEQENDGMQTAVAAFTGGNWERS